MEEYAPPEVLLSLITHQVQDYLAAGKKAPERVADFLRRVIQEKAVPQRRRPTREHRHSEGSFPNNACAVY